MQTSEEREEEKTQEKYTQFTPPYPNKYEPDLELNTFPSFTNIELKNPTQSQLSLRGEEAKRLNIIYDNNNNFSEDKNIKEILSNELKNSNKYNDIYDIDLPECFKRSSIVSNKKEKIEELKKDEPEEKKEENINMNISNNENIKKCEDDFDIDIDFNEKDVNNDNNEIKPEEYIDKSSSNEKNDLNIKKDENEDNNKVPDINYEELNKHYKMFLIDKNDFREEIIDQRKVLDNHIEENNIKNNNDNYEIEIDNENESKAISGAKAEKNHKIKKKHQKHKINLNNSNKNQNSEEKSKDAIHDITTLNINGLNSNEYYLGEIIEKGPNFPSTLGIVKYMDLDLFSENYFGERLQFNEISLKDDFQKIIKLVPVGNKKYIFSKQNSPESDITREENDLIILHGKGGQETFYYIMKLTGQINGNSEYTIYKVNNNKKIIRHFKDSIGLVDSDRKDSFESNDIVTEGINYDITENPDIEYLIMQGQQFLTKYRKLTKKENDVEEKKKLIEEKKNYNLEFRNNYATLVEKYNQIIAEKKLELENKTKNIQKEKETLNDLSNKIIINKETLKKIEEKKINDKKIEERLKEDINKKKKKLNNLENANKELEQKNIRIKNELDITFMQDKLNLENEMQLNESKKELEKLKEKIKKWKDNIFCIECNERRREVIFDCSHLMLCKECLSKYLINQNKTKAQCPICKKISRRFFEISYD